MKRRAFFKAGLSLGAISLLEPIKGANILASSFEGVTYGPIVLSTWIHGLKQIVQLGKF